jgi:hypothetical protein
MAGMVCKYVHVIGKHNGDLAGFDLNVEMRHKYIVS